MPASSMSLSAEEIRRAPRSAGDVSRIISSFLSVAKINDTTNSLVVRGGNPAENALFIDNIEVPNINHFPRQGTSGGAIGLLNVDFIQDVNFYSGNFGPRWEYSMRWIYAGGVPYTPWDLEQSTLLNKGIFDQSLINAERQPAYHSLNLRMERRFHFLRSNMTASLDIWNAYNRKNIGQYYWNEVKNEPGEEYQWSMLPVIGLEYEF